MIEILKMRTMNATVLMRSNDTPEFKENEFSISLCDNIYFDLKLLNMSLTKINVKFETKMGNFELKLL